MKDKGYKVPLRDLFFKEIESLKDNLDSLIGEYVISEDEVKYSNQHIAELIVMNCIEVMDLEEEERNDVIAIMAMFMKYGNAFIYDNEECLEEIEKRVIDSKYAGVHYFFKEAIFDENISKKDKKLVIRDVFDKNHNSAFVEASNNLFKLLEETNQLYVQVVWYDKVLTTMNKYNDNLNKLNNNKR